MVGHDDTSQMPKNDGTELVKSRVRKAGWRATKVKVVTVQECSVQTGLKSRALRGNWISHMCLESWFMLVFWTHFLPGSSQIAVFRVGSSMRRTVFNVAQIEEGEGVDIAAFHWSS
jgi:hypothetical protein